MMMMMMMKTELRGSLAQLGVTTTVRTRALENGLTRERSD